MDGIYDPEQNWENFLEPIVYFIWESTEDLEKQEKCNQLSFFAQGTYY